MVIYFCVVLPLIGLYSTRQTDRQADRVRHRLHTDTCTRHALSPFSSQTGWERGNAISKQSVADATYCYFQFVCKQKGHVICLYSYLSLIKIIYNESLFDHSNLYLSIYHSIFITIYLYILISISVSLSLLLQENEI